MTFIVHLSFIAFCRDLVKGSVVYSAVYSRKDEPGVTLLLTSEVSDRIHAVQLTITDDREVDSLRLIEGFLKENDITMNRGGVLLTDGLQDALRYWGSRLEHNLQELKQILEGGKLREILK